MDAFKPGPRTQITARSNQYVSTLDLDVRYLSLNLITSFLRLRFTYQTPE